MSDKILNKILIPYKAAALKYLALCADGKVAPLDEMNEYLDAEVALEKRMSSFVARTIFDEYVRLVEETKHVSYENFISTRLKQLETQLLIGDAS